MTNLRNHCIKSTSKPKYATIITLSGKSEENLTSNPLSNQKLAKFVTSNRKSKEIIASNSLSSKNWQNYYFKEEFITSNTSKKNWPKSAL